MKIVIALAVVVGLAGPAAPALAASMPGAPTVNPTPTAAASTTAAQPAGPVTAPGRGAPPVNPTPPPAAPPPAPQPAGRVPAVHPGAGPAPVLVARYSFDGGAVGGHIADTSGRGTQLTVRAADRGTVRF